MGLQKRFVEMKTAPTNLSLFYLCKIESICASILKGLAVHFWKKEARQKAEKAAEPLIESAASGIHDNACAVAWQRFDAAFTALVMIDYFDYSQNKTFLASTGYPFLRLTVDFIESYVRNDTQGPDTSGYSLHIHHGCAQEGCVGQPAFSSANETRWKQMEYGDTTPDIAFFKYALRAAIRLSAVLGVDDEKR